MTVSLWADVGGTFTDCILQRAATRRSSQVTRQRVKVLSSGLVAAAIERCAPPHTIRLRSLPAAAVPNFWCGATANLLTEAGSRVPLGTIAAQDGTVLRLTESLVQDAASGTVELDAGLEAPVLAAHLLTATPLSDPLPELDVRLGSTLGTNALLTRRGAATALLVTEGFGDLLQIGDQARSDLFALNIAKPQPLAAAVIEVRERLAADGNVLRPIDLQGLGTALRGLQTRGIESLAICFLHAHVNDVHEVAAEQLAREAGFSEISRSSEVAPLVKLLARAETTTLDAYLNPILAGYVARVWQQFGGPKRCRLRLMTSGGNLVSPTAFRGRDSILSGPAGGVVALGHIARSGGASAAVGLDMGGTSTDVSRYQGRVGRRYESTVSGLRVLTPMMDIETIAAGGGSICELSPAGRLTVGPASAGADPGPACYGRGGPLTITDVNLLLGRIPSSRFPFPLSSAAAAQRLRQVQQQLPAGQFATPQALAAGFLQIAVTHMAEAVRTVSTAQGVDVRDMVLVGFGGAAGQHVCRVADALGIHSIIDHPDAGLMSALGMGLARIGRVVTRGIYRPLDAELAPVIDQVAAELVAEAEQWLRQEEDPQPRYRAELQCDLRYLGTEPTLAIVCQPKETLAERFHAAHLDAYGYRQPDRAIELVALRCEATLIDREALETPPPAIASQPVQQVQIWHGDGWVTAAQIERDSLRSGDEITAPAMVVGAHSTLLIEPPWHGVTQDDGTIVLRPLPAHRHPSQDMESRHLGAAVRSPDDPDPPTGGEPVGAEAAETRFDPDDPVLLEIVARRLQGIADAMGEVLRRTSISVNVKERRDYSCAVFRRDGALVANAPHVPVHLGAMGHTVRHLIQQFPRLQPGDCLLSNDPYAGGSHLPDLTAVTPVFCGHSTQPDFFVASRAHHAEIGGRTPGSMPPDASCLADEGVVIRDFPLIRGGTSHFDELRRLLSSGLYPSRAVEENLADVAAQAAAGAHGSAALMELAATYSPAQIEALMTRLLSVAGDQLAAWIETLSHDPLCFSDALDDGSRIGVRVQRRGTRLEIAFDTCGVHPGCYNATPAIVTAAVLYVLRTVSGSQLPLCDGVLDKIDLLIPPGILNPPGNADASRCAAVVAGNVETSQRVVDVLLGALGVAAASQGTMNNVLIGDATFGYYETIAGGSGATATGAGADAVHTHMTNTRITDPEVLEQRLPVRLQRFAIRRGSGGAGRHRGGDGIIREFEFLRPLTVSLLTGRRTIPPYGAAGGEPGATGRNRWQHQGEIIELPSAATIEVQAGDRLIIETPGGGGWG